MKTPPIGSLWHGDYGTMRVVGVEDGDVLLVYERLTRLGEDLYRRNPSGAGKVFRDPLPTFWKVWGGSQISP